MIVGIPQSPYYEAPRRTTAELEYIARRLFPAWRTFNRAHAKADTPGMWHEFMQHVAATDLQAAQHWDDLTSSDMRSIEDRFHAWMRDGAALAWAAAKLVTGDWRRLPDGTIEVRVERQGVPYLVETIATEEAAIRRLEQLREKMKADGWSLL